VVVTNGIKKRLLERGIPESRVTVIPNGANTELYTPRQPSPVLQQKLGLNNDQFIIIYTGLIGLIHGLETILETAELLNGEVGIQFLIVGDGPRKTDLIELRESRSINNVLFHDAVPEGELPEYIALADVGLHVQLGLEISKMALPVKMFSYMACERPVLLAIEGEAAELLESTHAGLVVPPENPQALADAIIALRKNPKVCREYGKNGRQIVESKYSRRVLADQLATLLENELN
jgi:glycosyltransferase involved in cell wall biosynthesis